MKKARKAKVLADGDRAKGKLTKKELSGRLFSLAQFAQEQGWSAEDLLRREIQKREQGFRRAETASTRQNSKLK